jgi:hypothetical protein
MVLLHRRPSVGWEWFRCEPDKIKGVILSELDSLRRKRKQRTPWGSTREKVFSP